MKKITVFGSGYVGAITGIGLANLGNQVEIVDIDISKIESWNENKFPIYEIGLTEYFFNAKKSGLLNFTNESRQNSDIYFIAVGTPKELDSDAANLKYVWSVAETIGEIAKDQSIVITKSTVPVGTNKKLELFFNKKFKKKKLKVISNPEFLKEGAAFKDFFEPSRIILGGSDNKSIEVVKNLYRPIIELRSGDNKVDILITDLNTAELIKHASNGFLAIKLSYVNELARLCESFDANIHELSKGMGLDNRIGKLFLNPSSGWGGSCFPKDSRELVYSSNLAGVSIDILKSAISSNEIHKKWCVKKALSICKENRSKTIGLLGLAFKANTDDIRESSSINFVTTFEEEGFKILVHDYKAESNFLNQVKGNYKIAQIDEIFNKCDAIIVNTEWPEYFQLNWKEIINKNSIKSILDFRNVISGIHSPKLYKLGM